MPAGHRCPRSPICSPAERHPGRLRIAASSLAPLPEAIVDSQSVDARTTTVALLRALGHEVEEIDPPWQVPGLSGLFGAVFCAHIALSIANSAIVGGIPASAAVMEPMSWAIYSMMGGPQRGRGPGRDRAVAGLRAPADHCAGAL